MKKSSARAILILIAALAVASAAPLAAQTNQHEHGQQSGNAGAKPDQDTKPDQMKMGEMKMHAAMMDMAAKKNANSEKLAALMATVKSASGDAKVAAMADVIAVLLEERTAMQEQCAAMMKH